MLLLVSKTGRQPTAHIGEDTPVCVSQIRQSLLALAAANCHNQDKWTVETISLRGDALTLTPRLNGAVSLSLYTNQISTPIGYHPLPLIIT